MTVSSPTTPTRADEHALPAEVVHGAVLDVDVVGVGRRRADVDLNPVDAAVARVQDGAAAVDIEADNLHVRLEREAEARADGLVRHDLRPVPARGQHLGRV